MTNRLTLSNEGINFFLTIIAINYYQLLWNALLISLVTISDITLCMRIALIMD